MDDDEIIAAIRAEAKAILEDPNEDAWDWCVRVTRMRDMLQEIHGKPIDHGDFRDAFGK